PRLPCATVKRSTELSLKPLGGASRPQEDFNAQLETTSVSVARGRPRGRTGQRRSRLAVPPPCVQQWLQQRLLQQLQQRLLHGAGIWDRARLWDVWHSAIDVCRA